MAWGWGDLTDGPFPLLGIMAMLLVDTVLYAALAWYLDKVRTSLRLQQTASFSQAPCCWWSPLSLYIALAWSLRKASWSRVQLARQLGASGR